MRDLLVATLSAAIFASAILFWIGCAVASFKAVANRLPGVSYWDAVSPEFLLFKGMLYTDVGMKWRRIYLWCICGFVATAIVAAVAGKLVGQPERLN